MTSPVCYSCKLSGHQTRGSSQQDTFGRQFVLPMMDAISVLSPTFQPFCNGTSTCTCPNCSVRLSSTFNTTIATVAEPFSPYYSSSAGSPVSPRPLQAVGTPRMLPSQVPPSPLLSPSQMEKTSSQFCPNHPEMTMNSLCVTCKLLVCTACSQLYHYYHTIHPTKGMPATPRHLEKIAKVELSIGRQAIESANELEDKISDERTKAIDEIKATFRVQQDALAKREAELIAKVDAIADIRIDSLSQQVLKIKEHLSTVKNLYDNQSPANHNHVESTEPLARQPGLHEQLILLKTTAKSPLFVLNEDETFYIKKDMDQAKKTLQSFCTISTAAYPPLCIASGDGLTHPKCNQLCTVTIATKDRTGALCREGGAPIFVEMRRLDNGTVPTNVRDHQDGTYSFTYKPPQRGPHLLVIAIRKQHIPGSPFNVNVEVSQEHSFVGRPKVVFGSEGCEHGQFNRPWGVAVDHHNNIIVGDRSNHRIQIFDSSGNFKQAFGSEGNRPGMFNRPAGVAVTREGYIVVADKDNHRIQVFKPDGRFLFMFGSKGSNEDQLIYPYDVAVNLTNGNIAVTDTGNHRLLIFNNQGHPLSKFGYKGYLCGHFDSPRGLAFGDEGQIIVSDFNIHHILEIQPDGATVRVIGGQGNGNGQFMRPQGVAIDNHGHYVVADSRNHRIVVMKPDGQMVAKLGTQGSNPGQLDRPTSVAVMPNDHIVVVDFGNSRIQIF